MIRSAKKKGAKGLRSETGSAAESAPKCVFCLRPDLDAFLFGKMLKYNQCFSHYYCLLFASGLQQRGKDNEGMLGFLIDDIKKEAKRGARLKCCKCRKNGATVGCAVKTCKKMYHMPCGLEIHALNQFYGNFLSFCSIHRPKQEMDEQIANDLCPTCLTSVTFDEGLQSINTPCCKKLFHRECIQKQALSAGYYFKCPLCNNKVEFKKEMQEFGINIPKQDASWERENNAFGELYQRHSSCDMQVCQCDRGRQHNPENSTQWQIILCNTCGSQGAHVYCANIKSHRRWNCEDCDALTSMKKIRVESTERGNQNDGYDRRITPIAGSSLSTLESGNSITDDHNGRSVALNLDKETPEKPDFENASRVQTIDSGTQTDNYFIVDDNDSDEEIIIEKIVRGNNNNVAEIVDISDDEEDVFILD